VLTSRGPVTEAQCGSTATVPGLERSVHGPRQSRRSRRGPDNGISSGRRQSPPAPAGAERPRLDDLITFLLQARPCPSSPRADANWPPSVGWSAFFRTAAAILPANQAPPGKTGPTATPPARMGRLPAFGRRQILVHHSALCLPHDLARAVCCEARDRMAAGHCPVVPRPIHQFCCRTPRINSRLLQAATLFFPSLGSGRADFYVTAPARGTCAVACP